MDKPDTTPLWRRIAGVLGDAFSIKSAWDLFPWGTAVAVMTAAATWWDGWFSSLPPVLQVSAAVSAVLLLGPPCGAVWRLVIARDAKGSIATTSDGADSPPLQEVFRRHYQGETVILDGYSLVECEFTNCTFVYNGGPFALTRAKVHSLRGFMTTSDAVGSALKLAAFFGMLRDDGSVKGLMAEIPKSEAHKIFPIPPKED